MLNKFRTLGDTIIVKTLLSLLTLSFVLWGVGDYIVGGSHSSAITIDSTSYSTQDISRLFENAKQNIAQRTGKAPTNEELLQNGTVSRLFAEIIQESSFLSAATDLDLNVPTQALTESIENTQLFQTNGKFDVERYRSMVRNIGYTTEGYENEQRQSLTVELVSNLFHPDLRDPAVIKRRTETELSTLNIDVATLTEKDLAEKPTPTQEQIEAYYQANQAKYMTEETRDVSILMLDIAKIAEAVAVSDEEISKLHYDENKTAYSTAEKRSARHILLENAEQAEQVSQEIQNGADFAAKAEELSLDKSTSSKGGDLGVISCCRCPCCILHGSASPKCG